VDLTQTEERIAAFSSLADPTRRRLYLAVGAGRDEAAESVGISRGLAAFHLDRLIADGLLVAEYRRLTGRTGPGAGRPAKIYRRSARDLSFSVPQRNHELLARLFAQAFSSTDGNPLARSARWPASTWISCAGRTSRSCGALHLGCGSRASKPCWTASPAGVAWYSSECRAPRDSAQPLHGMITPR
jgi:DNA-binding transcriptional ArsR family regulator